MSDIVERLVRFADKVCLSTDTEVEAADTIEALRAENARLQKDLHEYVMQAESGNQKQVAEMCELRKEIARLRDLLDNALGWLDDKEHDEPLLSVDSIRAARTAMGDST